MNMGILIGPGWGLRGNPTFINRVEVFRNAWKISPFSQFSFQTGQIRQGARNNAVSLKRSVFHWNALFTEKTQQGWGNDPFIVLDEAWNRAVYLNEARQEMVIS